MDTKKKKLIVIVIISLAVVTLVAWFVKSSGNKSGAQIKTIDSKNVESAGQNAGNDMPPGGWGIPPSDDNGEMPAPPQQQ